MTVEQLLAAIIGPVGALVLAVAGLYVVGRVVKTLWDDHLRSDTDVRTQRDAADVRADAALDISRQQVAATTRLADAIEARARADAKRTRRTDV